MAGKAVKPIPEGYHTVTPFLNVKGVAKLIDFLEVCARRRGGHADARARTAP